MGDKKTCICYGGLMATWSIFLTADERKQMTKPEVQSADKKERYKL
jgi:hypothetical protein